MLARLQYRASQGEYPTSVRQLAMSVISNWLDDQDHYDEIAKEQHRERAVANLTDEQFETLLEMINQAEKSKAPVKKAATKKKEHKS
jgi:hypothetical protein